MDFMNRYANWISLLALFQMFAMSSGCSRSEGLASGRVDCGLGIRVFTDGEIHCVFVEADLSEADECPDPTQYRYGLAGAVICSTRGDLSEQSLGFIYNAAWPPDIASDEFVDAGLDLGLRFQELDASAVIQTSIDEDE